MNGMKIVICCTVLTLGSLPVSALALAPTPEEMTLAQEWIQTYLGPEAKALPFSFSYNSAWTPDLLKAWKKERTSKNLDESRTQTTLTFTDPQTTLEVRCVVVEYHDFPTVEWTVYFKNTGTSDAPFLDNIRALDLDVKRDPDPKGQFLLHHHRGSPANRSDYMPLETPLPMLGWARISAKGDAANGRPTDSDWPYFNLEWNGGKKGMIVVVGWPGQWTSEWRADEGAGLRITAGQERTHFKLRPGEEIRTPLIVLQFWQGGDWIDAQNLWRRWMIQHNVPRPGGKLPAPMFSGFVQIGNFCMYGSDEEDSKQYIDYYLDKGLQPDCYWMDTGWFVEGWEPDHYQNWEPDRTRFPNGIRPISDYAHAKGLKTILWFEPERVWKSWLSEKHPEWCLSSSTHPHQLLDLGHPEALQWITDRVHNRLTEEDIDIFRSDFNFSPSEHWQQNDPPDRQGILENHWVRGYLTFWDELLRRKPNLLIDSCASGGKRNDLETLRRSIILWRSDRDRNHDGGWSMQCQTYGISFWVPYHGAGAGNIDKYVFRSCMYPSLVGMYDLRRDDLDYDLLKQLLNEWRQINKYFFGDYYPLTPYSLYNDVWMAWQFDQPGEGEGVVQVFRHAENDETDRVRIFKLRGLEPQARYELVNFDIAEKTTLTGQELMENGLNINIPEKPAAVIVIYKKLK